MEFAVVTRALDLSELLSDAPNQMKNWNQFILAFQSLQTHLSLLFTTVVTFMDIKYVCGGGPSFLRLHGNERLSVPGHKVQYTYLWSGGAPSLNANNHEATFTIRIASNWDVQYLVPKLYNILNTTPGIVRSRYRNHLN